MDDRALKTLELCGSLTPLPSIFSSEASKMHLLQMSLPSFFFFLSGCLENNPFSVQKNGCPTC